MDTSDKSNDDEASIHQSRSCSSVKQQVPNEVNESFTKEDQDKDFHGGAQDALWNERLQELKLFRENHGHCVVVPQYLPLGMGGHAAAAI